MAYEKDPNEIGALWRKESNRGEYLTGSIEGVGRVVLFQAKPTERGPAWRVLRAKERDQQPAQAPRAQADGWSAAPPVVTDEDIPFAWVLPLLAPLGAMACLLG